MCADDVGTIAVAQDLVSRIKEVIAGASAILQLEENDIFGIKLPSLAVRELIVSVWWVVVTSDFPKGPILL